MTDPTPLTATATPVPTPAPEVPPMPKTLWMICYAPSQPEWVCCTHEPVAHKHEIPNTRHRIDIVPSGPAKVAPEWEALRKAAELAISTMPSTSVIRGQLAAVTAERDAEREAVRVLGVALIDAASGLKYIEKTMTRQTGAESFMCSFYADGVGWGRVEDRLAAVLANPIARTAVEAAQKKGTQ